MSADLFFGLGSILLGGFLLWGAAKLPRGVLTYALDPSLFPRFVAVGLILLGVVLFVGGWKKKTLAEKENSFGNAPLFRLLCLFAATMGYLLLWGRGWFLVNTFVYLFLLHLLFRFRLLLSVGSSFLVTLVTYLLFTQVFRVRLF